MQRFRPRSLVRYSLRSVLVLMTLCCVTASYVSRESRRIQRENQAINKLKALGATVTIVRKDLSWPLRCFVDEPGAAESTRVIFPAGECVLRRYNVNDDDLVCVRDLTSLEFLSLNLTAYSDRAMALLTNHDQLRVLWANSQEVTDASMPVFAKLSALEELSLGRGITDQGLAHLSRCPQLRVLNLSGTSVTGEGFRAFDDRSNISEINLCGSKIDDAGCQELHRLQHLASLKVCGRHLTDRAVEGLVRCESLRHLELRGPRNLSDNALASLAKLRNLESLNLSLTSLSDAPLQQIGRMPRLRRLCVSHCSVSDAGLKALAVSRSLESLDLTSTRITDEGLKHLGKIATLRELDLSFNYVTGEGLEHLTTLHSLESVNLSATYVRAADLEMLARLPSMKTIKQRRQCPNWDPTGKAALDLVKRYPKIRFEG